MIFLDLYHELGKECKVWHGGGSCYLNEKGFVLCAVDTLEYLRLSSSGSVKHGLSFIYLEVGQFLRIY